MNEAWICLWEAFRTPSAHSGETVAPSAGNRRLYEASGGAGAGAEIFTAFPRSLGSYLAAGPVCCAAVDGRRPRMCTLALWACVAALVPCRPALPVEPPCTVKTLPMLRDRASVEAVPLPPPPPVEPPDAVRDGSPAGRGVCWLGAGSGHALWHSARVIKLLLLPWQPPYQKCTHLEVTTSKW